MSKVLKIIGVVAGAVALFVPGLQALGISTIAGVSVGTIGAVAGIVAGVAAIGAQLLTKPPPARGSLTQMTVAADAVQPYVMGEGYFAGVLRYQRSYGAALDKVPNPYRFMAVVYSGGGPVQSISPRVDMEAIGSYYSGFIYTDSQTGACPESSALVPQWSGAPGWGSTSKLSGKAAIGWSLKFDKNGKVFASGMPQLGAYLQGVRVYDPRLDSTFPGGSGACRVDDESTFVYSANPALHAGTYALGRYQNGLRVLGIGLPADAINWANVAAWANVCDANGWEMFGVVGEPGDRWTNLRDICVAGGAEPVLAAGALYFHYAAPRVSVATIGIEHVMADQERGVTAQASWRDRLNTIVPKRMNADQNWQLTADKAVQVSTYLAEDGEKKQAEWPFNFVKDADQAAQLARYKLEDSRELQAIELPCIYEMVGLRPGDAVDLDLLEELGLEGQAVIVSREFDPESMAVKLTLVSETAGKHAYALGMTGTPPPTPALGQTAEERDDLAAAVTNPSAFDALLIANSYTIDADPLDGLLQATDTAITIENHSRVYGDKTVSVTGGTLTTEDDGSTALTASTLYHVYYDDGGRSGGAVSLKATKVSTTAANSSANAARHYVGSITTDVSGGGGTSGGGTFPGGWEREDFNTL